MHIQCPPPTPHPPKGLPAVYELGFDMFVKQKHCVCVQLMFAEVLMNANCITF